VEVDRVIASGILVFIIAAIHIFFPVFDKLIAKHQKIVLPFTAGIAIGYVFLYLLPKLSDFTGWIIEKDADSWEFIHYRLYILTLVGFLIYLFIERLSATNQSNEKKVPLMQSIGFCFANIMTGYIAYSLPRPGVLPYIIGTVAYCAYFIGVDHKLRHWHELAYDRYIKWFIAASILAGWGISLLFKLPKEFLMSATGLLSGGIMVTVMTGGLTEKNESRFAPFLAGIVFFLFLVTIMRSIPKVAA
jgi:hypothetical protein